MKTQSFLKLTMVIAGVIIISIVSCEQDSGTTPINNEETSYRPTKGPDNVLKLTKAVKLFNNYEERSNAITNHEQKFKSDFLVSRNVTFDYQELLNYLNYIEKYADKAGVNIKGLRFYFGKYPYDHEKYPGQQMLFFNPTIEHATKDGTIKEEAYAIEESEGEIKIRILSELDHTAITGDKKSSLKSKTIKSMIEQGGQVSPPDGN